MAVEHILDMLTAGDTIEVFLQGYPWLEQEDILAWLAYARRLIGHEGITFWSTGRRHLVRFRWNNYSRVKAELKYRSTALSQPNFRVAQARMPVPPVFLVVTKHYTRVADSFLILVVMLFRVAETGKPAFQLRPGE